MPSRVAGPGACEFSLASEDVAQSLLDLTLGVWSHLVADTVWNTRVNQYLEAHGGKPCEEFRIKKQGDFDWFGKTLGIVSIPRATDRLYTAAARFGQYPIHKEYVLKTIGVMHEIVRENPGRARSSAVSPANRGVFRCNVYRGHRADRGGICGSRCCF